MTNAVVVVAMRARYVHKRVVHGRRFVTFDTAVHFTIANVATYYERVAGAI